MWAFLWYLFGSSETVRLSTSAAISLRVVLSAAHPLSAAAKATLYFSLQLKLLHFFNEQIITGRARDIFPALLFASMPQASVYTNQLSEYQPRHHWYRIQSLCFLELRDLELQASSFVFFLKIPLCVSTANSHLHHINAATPVNSLPSGNKQ